MYGKKLVFFAKRFSKRLSFRASVFGLIAVAAALAASNLAHFVPDSWAEVIGSEAVDEILKILASSMLAVTTFSLSTMVAAYGSASEGVTPRAAKILMEDESSQNALSIFLGAFIFSVISLAALFTGYYGARGRAILFILTVLLIIAIVWTIIRWIGELSKLGRVHETISLIEKITRRSLLETAKFPFAKCAPREDMPTGMEEIKSEKVGYLQAIDHEGLQEIAEQLQQKFVLLACSGQFLHEGRPMLAIRPSAQSISPEKRNQIRSCFIMGDARTFEEDPRFGLIVLSEVASRSLSPAVNDPGTAIDVISSMVRLLTAWSHERKEASGEVKFPRLEVQEMSCHDMLEDVARPIARDGAGHIEVVIRLFKALTVISRLDDGQIRAAALARRNDLVQRARKKLEFAEDLAKLDELERNAT